jgi:G3E family GTPase
LEKLERWLGKVAGECGHADHEHDEHCGHEPHEETGSLHNDRVHTFSITLDTPVAKSSLAIWLTMLASFCGVNLLRVKGIINVAGRPMVINVVQFVLHEPVELEDWPSGDRRSHIVFIVQDMPRAELEKTIEALRAPESRDSADQIDPQAYAQFLQMAKTFM